MSCFKFLAFSRHVPLTIYQQNIKNILEAENQKKYQEQLETWKSNCKQYYEIYGNSRLFMEPPPEKKHLPCICSKCMEKQHLQIEMTPNQNWSGVNFDYTLMNLVGNNIR